MVEQASDVVLVVDDDAAVRTFLVRVVQRSGLGVVQAATLAEANALLGAHRFLLALVDKHLPDGSGIDVMDALRRHQPGAAVVMITGHLDASSAVDAMRAGATDVLSKPFDFRTLRDRLEALLSKARLDAERARLEALVAHTDRLATLGTLAAGVAHELANPLAMVLSSLEYLVGELRLEPTPERREQCTAASEEGRDAALRLRAIASELKRYARSELGTPGPVDLVPVVRQAVTLAQHATRNRITVEVETQPAPLVSGWVTRFEQVVVNLLVNAAQAIPPHRADGRVRVTLSESDDGGALLVVSDNGPGVPTALQPRLFKPFFTTKPEGQGTGLGLSIIADIVRAAGGCIEHEATPGGGATFRVQLPAAPPPVPRSIDGAPTRV